MVAYNPYKRYAKDYPRHGYVYQGQYMAITYVRPDIAMAVRRSERAKRTNVTFQTSDPKINKTQKKKTITSTTLPTITLAEYENRIQTILRLFMILPEIRILQQLQDDELLAKKKIQKHNFLKLFPTVFILLVLNLVL